jgi:thioredoxin reductase
MKEYDVVIIGGGPAGMAAAISAYDNEGKVLLIEREEKIGGILKQCIHDGFGLVKFNEQLTGPEYANRYIDEIKKRKIEILTETFVLKIDEKESFIMEFMNREGVQKITTKTIIFATGCRERTSKQIFIHGDRPAGIYTAGTAQYFTNILGFLPGKNCVILGSGDIGLIMARRLTLEGAKVQGVYEIKSEPSGLTRNIRQCLDDFDIPLYLSHKITRVFGKDRITGVEICQIDENFQPIPSTLKKIECDCLILSVGLIPENELIQELGIKINKFTNGPEVDNNFMSTEISGIFICGNAVHVNDLVDYVSESGEIAGKKAVEFIKNGEKTFEKTSVVFDEQFLYVVPQYYNKNTKEDLLFYFRSKNNFNDQKINIIINDYIISKKYKKLKSAEMERLTLKNDFESNLKKINLQME